MRSLWNRGLGVGLLVVAFAAPVRAQESPLAQVPAGSPLVLQVRGLETAQQRLGKMIGNALPDLAPNIAPQLESIFKTGPFAVRDLEGIRKDGTLFVVGSDLENLNSDDASIAVLIPVVDYATFKKGFLTAAERKTIRKAETKGVETVEIEEKKIYLVDKKTYLVATPNEELATEFTQKFAPLDVKLGKEAAAAFLAPDVAIMLNLEAVNEKYGEQLNAFKGLIEFGLTQVEGMDKATQEMVKAFMNGLFQVLEDGKGLMFGVEFRPEGLNFRMAIAFKDETPSNEFLTKLKLSPFAELEKLPGGQMSYSGSRLDEPLRKALNAYLMNALASTEDKKAAKAIKAAMTKLNANATGMSYSVGNIPVTGIEIIEYKDAITAADATLELLKSIPEDGEFQNIALKGKPKIEEKAQTYRDYTLTAVTMRLDLDKALDAQPGAEQMREEMKAAMIKMFGGEETKFWFGTDGKQFVQLTAPNWKVAQKLLDDYLDGKTVGKNEAFATTRKQLPAEATMLSMFETNRTVLGMWDYMSIIVQSVPGFPLPNIPELKAAKGPPSFIGTAIALKKDIATADLFIPTTAVQQFRTIFGPLLQNPDQ